MKDMLVQIGLVVLGALIVISLIMGTMKSDTEAVGKTMHTRMEALTVDP